MKIQSKIRQLIIRLFLALAIAAGAASMPFTTWVHANQEGPQDGGRGRIGPQVICHVETYDLIVVIMVVTTCSDGSSSVTFRPR